MLDKQFRIQVWHRWQPSLYGPARHRVCRRHKHPTRMIYLGVFDMNVDKSRYDTHLFQCRRCGNLAEIKLQN